MWVLEPGQDILRHFFAFAAIASESLEMPLDNCLAAPLEMRFFELAPLAFPSRAACTSPSPARGLQ